MSCQIHVPAKANTKMGKSFKRHYTTDISVYVYLRMAQFENLGELVKMAIFDA